MNERNDITPCKDMQPIDLPVDVDPVSEPAANPNPNCDPVNVAPYWSAHIPKPSAAGAAMRELSYESVMDRMLREICGQKSQTQGGALLNNNEVGVFITDTDKAWCYTTEVDNPKTYQDILKSLDAPLWEMSMTNEMNSLSRHNIWELIP